MWNETDFDERRYGYEDEELHRVEERRMEREAEDEWGAARLAREGDEDDV